MTPIFGWTISLRALLVVSNIQSKESHVPCFSCSHLSPLCPHSDHEINDSVQLMWIKRKPPRVFYWGEDISRTPNLQQWEDGIAYINSFLHRSSSAVRSTCTTKDTEDKVIRWNLALVCCAVMSIRSCRPLNWSVLVISLAWGRHNRQRSPSSPR